MPPPTKPHANSVLWDSYDRADTTTGLGTADCRLDYQGDTTFARILGNAAVEVTPGTGRMFAILDGYSDHQEVYLDITTSATTNTTDVGPVARSLTSTAGGVGKRLYLRVRKISGANRIDLLNQNPTVAGSDTVLASNTSAGLADNTNYVVMLKVTAAGLATGYLDGTPITGIVDIDISALDLPGRGAGFTINRTNDGGSKVRAIDVRHSGTRQTTSTQVIAHRASLASLGPEAEEKIATLAELPTEANGIEVDVRLSSDGVPVLMHDTTIDRTTAGSGTVSAMTFAALQAEGVPGLEEFLDEVQASCNFNTIFAQLLVPDGDLATIAAVIDAHPLRDKIIAMAATQSALDNVRDAYTGRIGNYGTDLSNVDSYVTAALTETAEVLYVVPGDTDYITNRAAVADIHDDGLDAGASTVNGGEAVLAAFADGVEYLLTDRADLVTYSFNPPDQPLNGDASQAVTLGVSATAKSVAPASASQAVTLGASGSGSIGAATVSGSATQVTTLGTSAAAHSVAPGAASQAVTMGVTATGFVTKTSDANQATVLGASGSASAKAPASAAQAVTLGVSASGSIVGVPTGNAAQTVTLGAVATASATLTASATQVTTLGAAAAATARAPATAAQTVTLGASAAGSAKAPAAAQQALVLGATASASATKFATAAQTVTMGATGSGHVGSGGGGYIGRGPASSPGVVFEPVEPAIVGQI